MTDQKTDGLARWLSVFIARESEPDALKRWVEDTTTAILGEVPEIADADGIGTGIRDTVAEHWESFLRQLSEPTFSFHLVDRAKLLAVEVANSRLTVETLIRFYRVAQQTTWAYISREVEELPDDDFDHGEVLIYFWDRASQWIDQSITASIQTFHEERGRAQAGVAAQRYETVLEVLNGQHDDPRRISTALGGYPMSVIHSALVLTCDEHDGVSGLEQLAQDLARSLGVTQPLLVRPSGRRLWVWIGTRTEPELGALVEEFNRQAASGTRAGIGSGWSGIPGFIATFKEAEGALRLAASGSIPAVCQYGEVELLVLLGCTPQVDRFVSRTLGGLAASDEATARRRETISAYLEAGGNVDDAALALQVHRNTVRYRIAQAEKALDMNISRLSPSMTVALQHLDVFHAGGSLELVTDLGQ
ncbi:PucR family transcriptional regulator [Aeromicrobium marinum]|nr:helix-turn-helix domain-containing protein [Aeromicrobium marinum]